LSQLTYLVNQVSDVKSYQECISEFKKQLNDNSQFKPIIYYE
jgi:hypothetical protein